MCACKRHIPTSASQKTPLHKAAYYGEVEFVVALLDRGANIEAKDKVLQGGAGAARRVSGMREVDKAVQRGMLVVRLVTGSVTQEGHMGRGRGGKGIGDLFTCIA